MTKEAKDCLYWTHSKENQGFGLKKTKVHLRFLTDTSKMMMIRGPKVGKKDPTDKNYKVNGETVWASL